MRQTRMHTLGLNESPKPLCGLLNDLLGNNVRLVTTVVQSEIILESDRFPVSV